MPKSSDNSNKRIAALQRRIAGFDFVCSGNLRQRYTVCGTANCRCKAQPPEPHGPYYYWSRLLGGKVVQRVLSPEEAEIVARGIKNYREVRELLRRWEEETVRKLEIRRRAKRHSPTVDIRG
jgi:hypothetical protein